MAKLDPDLVARLRQARADHEAGVRAVADGTAEPEVYAALEFAYPAADEAPDGRRDDARDFAVTLVLDAIGKARHEGEPIDPETIGKAAAVKISKMTEFMAKGSVLGALRSLRLDTSTIGRVRSDLAEARLPLPEPVEPAEPAASPLAEWRAASEARGDRQTHALEGLLRLSEQQTRGMRLMIVLTAIAALTAVVATADDPQREEAIPISRGLVHAGLSPAGYVAHTTLEVGIERHGRIGVDFPDRERSVPGRKFRCFPTDPALVVEAEPINHSGDVRYTVRPQ